VVATWRACAQARQVATTSQPGQPDLVRQLLEFVRERR